METEAKRRLAAIFAADVVGYSRLTGRDEEGTLARVKAVGGEVVEPALARHHGRKVKTTGDGLLAEFASVVDALRAALEVQRSLAQRAQGEDADRRMVLRIGVNLGDIVVDGDDIFGDGVNIAARLETLCPPGEVCISAEVRKHAEGKLAATFEDLGRHRAKNIAEPIHAFAVRLGPAKLLPASFRRTALLAAAGLAGLIVVGAAGWFALDRQDAPAPSQQTAARPVEAATSERPAIAVLPFANLSNDPEQEFFSDGLADDILSGLSRFAELKVIARNSSFKYKGQTPDIRKVWQELGVGYVLEGSVRRGGGRLRITAQLIDTRDGKHVWAETFERPETDMLVVQDELTQKVVAGLNLNIRRDQNERTHSLTPDKFGAYELTVLGRSLQLGSADRASILKGREVLEQAVALAPDYAPAHIWLTQTYNSVAISPFLDDPTRLAAGRLLVEAGQKAVTLAPRDALAHAIYAGALTFAGRWDEALAEADRAAVALNPNDAWALHWAAVTYYRAGEAEKSVKAYALYRALDPFPPRGPLVSMMSATYQAKAYEETVQFGQRCRAVAPDSPLCLNRYAAALGQLGRTEEARAVVRAWLKIAPSATIAS